MEMNGTTVLDGLNSEQKAAVSCVEGPVLIVAGAGSGKTRVLTSRIAYILSRGCDPSRILALTFTKKAASEMKERIAVMVGEKLARRLYMGTFHSVFIRFLREFSESLGYPQSFTIYDTGDSVSAIKACLKDLGLDDKVYKPKDVLSRISMAKNNLVTPSAYRRNATVLQNDAAAKKPRIVDIYERYNEKCRQAGVMDFDDILLNMNILLRDNPAALESIAGRFDYIMVDEYQDTNYSQYLILKKLSQFHKNICVVGDDSQSIYAFRGAKIENILNFKKDYPDSRIFRLEQNYRSTKIIVEAANSVISRNSSRIPKECYSLGVQGDKIKLIKAFNEKNEVELIARSILSHIGLDKAEYQDFAILYRTLNQSRVFEQYLHEERIPYQVCSGLPFLERKEVKDVLSFLKLFANTNDNEAFKRVASLMPGIGDATIEILLSASKEYNQSLSSILSSFDLKLLGFKTAAINRLTSLRDDLELYSKRAYSEDCYEFARDIVLRYDLLSKYKNQNSEEELTRAANVEEMLDWIQSESERIMDSKIEDLYVSGEVQEGVEIKQEDLPSVTIGEFLENASLLSSADNNDDGNKVKLMTIHAAKGLEFPYVYIAGLEENIFPSGGLYISDSELEEERRLFYVAMTRAKKSLELSFASTRFRNGKHESNSPSRFVREIDVRYVANPLTRDDDDAPAESGGSGGFWKKSSGGSFKPGYQYGQSSRAEVVRRAPAGNGPDYGRRDQTLRREPSYGPGSAPQPVRRPQPVPKRVSDVEFEATPILQLRAGQRIEHNRFGFGQIMEISGQATDLKAKIAFDDHGEKILLLKYAKIRVVS